MGKTRWSCPLCACKEQVLTTCKRSLAAAVTATSGTGSTTEDAAADVTAADLTADESDVQSVEETTELTAPVLKRPKLLPTPLSSVQANSSGRVDGTSTSSSSSSSSGEHSDSGSSDEHTEVDSSAANTATAATAAAVAAAAANYC
jgi:hypothetical protein